MIGKIKDEIEKRIEPLASLLPRNPNAITMAGLAFAIISIVPSIYDKPLLTLVLVALSGLMDGLDGLAARKHKMTSAFGAFLDSTLDRYVDFILVMDAVMLEPSMNLMLIGFVSYLGAVMTSYIRARGESLGLKMSGRGLLERPERMLYMMALLLITAIVGSKALLYGMTIFAALTNLTAIQRGIIVAHELKGAERMKVN